ATSGVGGRRPLERAEIDGAAGEDRLAVTSWVAHAASFARPPPGQALPARPARGRLLPDQPAAGPPPACRRPPAGPPPARVRWPPVVRLTQDRSGGQDRAVPGQNRAGSW